MANLRGFPYNLQAACGYVADKIGRLCSGKSEEKGEVKGITERKCVLSGGSVAHSASDSQPPPYMKDPLPSSPPPAYQQ